MWTNLLIAHLQVSSFLLRTLHQISTLEKTKFASTFHSEWSDELASITDLSVPDCYSFTSSEVFDFHIWFSLDFLMQWNNHIRVLYVASSVKIHHRLRLCCDSFFTCIFLRSFRHYFTTICGTEMADVKQTQKMVPFITCEVSLGQYVCLLVFGFNVFDLDFVDPNWFYRTTNQEQLCGIWKHVSLSGFFLLWSSWSLFHFFKKRATKLPNVKIRRLRN